ncbi:hypothetical protein [Nocardia fluminea]|uniref:hypothetical protein n=1 Tax=Nocardia fluminea TaxID=134984 RepID=UPI00364F5728
MAIDEKAWDQLMGNLSTVTETLPGTDPENLAALREALENGLDAVNAEAAAQQIPEWNGSPV